MFCQLITHLDKCSEIIVNSSSSLLRKNPGGIVRVLKSPFENEEQANEWVLDFAIENGVRLDPFFPSNGGMIDSPIGRLRWHAMLRPFASPGPVFCLRKLEFGRFSFHDFDPQEFFWPRVRAHIESGRSLLICGPTGVGKTSLLYWIVNELLAGSLVYILEQLDELPTLNRNWIKMIAQPPTIEGTGAVGLEVLLREVLRLNPDRMVVGELRGEEFGVWLQALDCGHEGIFSTMHASSVADVVRRLSNFAEEQALIDKLVEHSVGVLFLKSNPSPTIDSFQVLDRLFFTKNSLKNFPYNSLN